MKDRVFEVLDNEVDLFIRVKELKSLGYEEQDMYIITQDEDSVSMLRGYTNIMIKEEDHSLLERFKSFLKGEDSIIDAFKRMGLEKEEKEYYHNEVKNGRLLLLVDKSYESNYVMGEDGILRPVEVVENLSEDGTSDSESMELNTEEEIPDSIKRDIGITVEETEKDNMGLLKGEIDTQDRRIK